MYQINGRPNEIIESVVVALISDILYEKKKWVPVRHGTTDEDVYDKIDYIFKDEGEREIPVQIKTKSSAYLGYNDTRVSLREINNIKKGGGADYQIEACFDSEYSKINAGSKLLQLTLLELNRDFINLIVPGRDLDEKKIIKYGWRRYMNFPYNNSIGEYEYYIVPSESQPNYKFRLKSQKDGTSEFVGIPLDVEFDGRKLSEILYSAGTGK